MFYELRTSVPPDPETLQEAYELELRDVLGTTDLDAAAASTGIDRYRLEALQAGEFPSLSLREAASIVALASTEPDAETVADLACEHLLLGMTNAVMDVDTLAATVELDLAAKELQQKIERRAPFSFEEFVHVQHAIADRSP